MRHIQFQTDTQYLCFNHAVKQVLAGDERIIWAETLPKEGGAPATPRCIKCTILELDSDPERYQHCEEFLTEQATK